MLLADDAAAAVEAQARRLGTPALVRAMEVVGQALIDMRDAPDPRITLEVALVRLAVPDADDSRSALSWSAWSAWNGWSAKRLERVTGASLRSGPFHRLSPRNRVGPTGRNRRSPSRRTDCPGRPPPGPRARPVAPPAASADQLPAPSPVGVHQGVEAPAPAPRSAGHRRRPSRRPIRRQPSRRRASR